MAARTAYPNATPARKIISINVESSGMVEMNPCSYPMGNSPHRKKCVLKNKKMKLDSAIGKSRTAAPAKPSRHRKLSELSRDQEKNNPEHESLVRDVKRAPARPEANY
jgi:hypothetical protein